MLVAGDRKKPGTLVELLLDESRQLAVLVSEDSQFVFLGVALLRQAGDLLSNLPNLQFELLTLAVAAGEIAPEQS